MPTEVDEDHQTANLWHRVAARSGAARLHILAILVCIVWAWQVGHDSNWDLFNYHLYNGLALLDGSFNDDIAPGGLQTYLNPVVDIPLAVAVNLVGVRGGVIAASALTQYLCYLAVWRLTKVLTVEPNAYRTRVVLTLFAVVGAGAMSLAFTTFGDWIVAAALCEGLRLILRARSIQESGGQPRWDYIVGGAIIGAAVGVKLTVAPFGIALLIALPLLAGWGDVLRTAAGMLGGFLASAGPWMIYLQVRFGSPLFPFLNNIFQADSAPFESFDDARFGATGIIDALAAPLRLAKGSSEYGEFLFREWRFIAVAIAALVSLLLRGRSSQLVARRPITYMAAVLLISYSIWVLQFGYYRYFLFGEILASLLFVLIVFELVADSRRASAYCLAIAAGGLVFQHAPDWGRNVPLVSPPLTQVTSEIDGGYTVAILAIAPVGYLKASMAGDPRILYVYGFVAGAFVVDGAIGTELIDALDSAMETDSLYAITELGAAGEIPYVDGAVLVDCVEIPDRDRLLQFCGVKRP
ncbi:MAG TPA: hypothetical protein VK853_01890 [Ilumatobacteraceae bacterium]|nr:hypothetical protein [Ilumatobacteraceae bacterium]